MSAEETSPVVALFRCYLDVSCTNPESSTLRFTKMSRVITIPVSKSLSQLTLHEWHDNWLPYYISKYCGLEATSFNIQAMYIPHTQHNYNSLAPTTAAEGEHVMVRKAVNKLLYLPSEMIETNEKWYNKLNVNDFNNESTVMADVLPDNKNDSHSLPTSKLPMYEIVVEVVVDSAKCTDEEKENLKETKENSDNTNNDDDVDCNVKVRDSTDHVLSSITELLQAERHARDELVDVEMCEFSLVVDSNADELRKMETLQTLQGNSIQNGQLASFLRKSRRYPFDTIPLYLIEHEKQLHRNDYTALIQEAQTTAVLSRAFDKFVDKQCNHSENSNININENDDGKSMPSSFRAALQHAINREREAAQREADEEARVQYYTDADLPVPPRPETPPTPRELTMEDIPDDVYDNAIEFFLHGRREIVTHERVAYRELVSLMQRVLQRQREADAYALTCAALSELQSAAPIFQLDTYLTSKEPIISVYDDVEKNNKSGNESVYEEEKDYGSKNDQIPSEYKINVSWQVDQDGQSETKAKNNATIANSNTCVAKHDNTSTSSKKCIPVPAKHVGEVQQIQNIMHTLRTRATVTLEARMERQVVLHCETKQRQQIIDEEMQYYEQISTQTQQ